MKQPSGSVGKTTAIVGEGFGNGGLDGECMRRATQSMAALTASVANGLRRFAAPCQRSRCQGSQPVQPLPKRAMICSVVSGFLAGYGPRRTQNTLHGSQGHIHCRERQLAYIRHNPMLNQPTQQRVRVSWPRKLSHMSNIRKGGKFSGNSIGARYPACQVCQRQRLGSGSKSCFFGQASRIS